MASDLIVRSDTEALTYTFRNTRPVELLDLTSSLLAIGEQYRSFIRRQNEALAEDEYRLYVREIRTGCIIVDLISLATQPQVLGPIAPFVVQFTTELSDWFDFFKGIKDAKDIKEMLTGASKRDLQQISQIVELPAKDPGSQISITATNGGVVIVNAPLTATEANAGQNLLRRYIDAEALPITGVHRDQVVYWYQVRDDRATKPGDLGVIERLWKKPVKVRFASDDVKRGMIDKPDNPFRKLYVVDVDVTESAGRPVLYRILEVKDTIERDEVVA